jgi:hypothetical protein
LNPQIRWVRILGKGDNMQEFFHFLEQLNLPTIIAVIGASWFFSRKLNLKIDKIEEEIKGIHKDMKTIREDMYREFKFINIRLSRVEGKVYGKDIYKTEES